MLQAILSGKKRGTGLENRDLWAGKFEGAEDVLTSLVFGSIRYLSLAAQTEFLDALLGGRGVIPDKLEEVQYDFWPRYSLGEKTVEPDLIIRFERHAILVEAKRHDGVPSQSPSQVSKELNAMLQAEAKELESVTILLVSGLRRKDWPSFVEQVMPLVQHGTATIVRFAYCDWSDIFDLFSSRETSLADHQSRTLCQDILNALALHGIAGTKFQAPLLELGLSDSVPLGCWHKLSISNDEAAPMRIPSLGELIQLNIAGLNLSSWSRE